MDIQPIHKVDIELLVQKKGGIRLDVGCGRNKQPGGFVGMDKRPIPEADIIHDIEDLPWPLPDECCLTIVAAHIMEHVKPWLTIDVFNEMWRVMKVGGQLAVIVPYGVSTGFMQDPTHCTVYVAQTFHYFNAYHQAYNIYEPHPWKVEKGFPVWISTGNVECLMTKITYEEAENAARQTGMP